MISTDGAWILTCAKQVPTRGEIGEIWSQVYDTLQTSDSSWELLKTENEQVKTGKKILTDETGMKLLNLE